MGPVASETDFGPAGRAPLEKRLGACIFFCLPEIGWDYRKKGVRSQVLTTEKEGYSPIREGSGSACWFQKG